MLSQQEIHMHLEIPSSSLHYTQGSDKKQEGCTNIQIELK